MAFEPLVVPSRLNRPDQFAEEAELCLNGVADFIEKYNELSSVLNGAITSTSTTSLTIGTGTKSPVVQPGLNLVPGYPIRLAYRVDPTKYMDGVVLTYDSETGALSSDISSPTGSGTYADWQVMVLAAAESSPVAGPTHAASSKTTPVDADEIPLIDSEDSFSLKHLTWANLKATLKNYFDAFYNSVLVKNAANDSTFSSTSSNDAASPEWVIGFTALKAWVNFNGTGTVAIRASRNVSSITDNGTGHYTANFTTAMPDTNYAAVMSCAQTSAGATAQVIMRRFSDPPTVNNLTVLCITSGGTANDQPYVDIAIFR